MNIFTEKIIKFLKEKNISQNELGKIIGYRKGYFSNIVRGKRPLTEDKIQKIASILEVSPEEIKGWIIADKYNKETLKRAIKLKQEHAGQEGLIFTAKMHELMKQHNLTINPFSKVIDYNQGWLSQVVLGKEPVSKKLMQKLCVFSGLPEEEITSWSVADKYSTESIQTALECYS